MEFFHLRAGEEFIRLGQVLKAAGFVENGGQAKEVIQDGFVSEMCIRDSGYIAPEYV